MDPADAPLTESLKAAIRRRYHGVCQYCGTGGAAVVEHIVARSKGGFDTLGNATLACDPCNRRKGARDLDPMYLAIAHARARDAAAGILALAPRREPAPRRPRPRPTPPPAAEAEPQEVWIEQTTAWGGFLVRPGEVAVPLGYMRPSKSGHRRDRSNPFVEAVRRPPRACRDMGISFVVDPELGRVSLVKARVLRRESLVCGERPPPEPAPAATEWEKRAAARYLRRHSRVVVADARALLAHLERDPGFAARAMSAEFFSGRAAGSYPGVAPA